MSDTSRLTTALGDRYHIERELGAGGMATVYLADDLRHERKVAVKVLRPELAATIGHERFLREIRIAAQLQHPHILPLLESGEADGYLYYVMPYVDGQSLRDRLTRQGELPIHEAVKLITEVVDALSYAHSHGVVHRDVKPDNVMLSGRHALVMDFGVAKAVSEASGRNQLTTAGVALGTPAYMAPEQAAADPHLDHRVDIYAVGVMAYELLAGRPPFVGGSPQQVLAAHVTETPDPVSKYRPGISPALEQAVMRCLAKRPADRWQSADELLNQLEPLATPSGGMTPTQTRPVPGVLPRRRKWMPAVAVGCVGILAAVLVMSLRGEDARPEFGRQQQLTRDAGLELDAALSPDGKYIAYVVDASGGSRILVRQVEGGAPVMIEPERLQFQELPQWSPDGNRILFLSERGIEVIPQLGGQPRLLIPGTGRAPLFPGSWAPTGAEFVYARGDSILVGRVDGPSRLVAMTIEPHSLAWSPDSRWIAFVSGNRESRTPGATYGNTAPSSLWVVPANGGTPVRVSEGEQLNLSPAWLPDSRRLLFISDRDGGNDVYTVSIGNSGQRAAAPVRLTTGLNASLLSLASDGGTAVYTVFQERSNIWSIFNTSGAPLSISQARPVTTGNQVIERFSISPEGQSLVYDSDRSGNSDLYVQKLGEEDVEQLTSDAIAEFAPRWSPDGNEIAYHAIVEGRRQIFILGNDRQRVQVTSGTDDMRIPAWSRNGQRLYAQANVATAPFGYVIERQTDGTWGTPRPLPVTGPPSPDERFVLNGRRLVSIDGSGPARQVIPDTFPTVREGTWSEDGSRIYFLAGDASQVITGVWSVNVRGGALRQHVKFDDASRPWHRYGFRVHGDRFYFTLGERESDVWAADIHLSQRP